MGRDHTLFAKEKGYVRYYNDPTQPKRRFIGVVFEKTQTLPTPPNAARRRRLNMMAVPRRPDPEEALPEAAPPVPDALEELTRAMALSSIRQRRIIKPGDVVGTSKDGTPLRMRSNYSFKESNIEIGRVAERAALKVKPFVKGDRWLAWQKANARKERNKASRTLAGASKKGKKGGKAKARPKARGKN
jgi:hypothetical protein